MKAQEKIKFDHVAIHTRKELMKETVDFYRRFLNGVVLHQDETWSLIEGSGVKIALVVPEQHPVHTGFVISDEEYIELIMQGKVFKKHRDGSKSVYIKDPSNNSVELLYWEKSKIQKIKENASKKVKSFVKRIL